MTDHEHDLIQRAQHGHIQAFEALIRTIQPRLFRFILAVARNPEDAENALQETMLHAYRALPRFRGEASFSTWLHRIALTCTRNWLRSQARASSEHFAGKTAMLRPQSPPAIHEQILAAERRRTIRLAILQLPAHYREAIILRHYEEMSYEEIADVVHAPIGTVRSRLAQARQLLLRYLGAHGYRGAYDPGGSNEMPKSQKTDCT